MAWRDELREHFPGYLLPASVREALSREAAERFLARLSGQPDALELLLAASALSPAADDVRAFARELLLVARGLSPRTRVERVEIEGAIRGRLDLPATLRKRLAGGPHVLVSRVHSRHFEVPENVLLVVTANRLVGLLTRLKDSNLIPGDSKQGWGKGFRACAEDIRRALKSTILRDISVVPIQALHERAARAARHPAYGLALRLHESMKSIDATDPALIAGLVANGALAPFDDPTRFEIAVLIRLGRSIDRVLNKRGFAMSRALIKKDRDHVFEFSSGGSCVRIHYNQVRFKSVGPRERGMRHYFGQRGRLRPDLTIEVLQDEKRLRAVVVEVKLSEDRKRYLKDGYHEALVYRAEYDKDLNGWPKAILVVSSQDAIKGAPRREDEVIAVSWKNWVPEIVLEGILQGVGEPHVDEAAPRR